MSSVTAAVESLVTVNAAVPSWESSPLDPASGAATAEARLLFTLPGVTAWAPSSDGERFLVAVREGAASSNEIRIDLDWPSLARGEIVQDGGTCVTASGFIGSEHSISDSPARLHVRESVGIAVGFLVAALHVAGLGTLTHTPSPMGFLNEILGRPANERPFLLLVVGHPADDCRVPVITKRPLGEIATFR